MNSSLVIVLIRGRVHQVLLVWWKILCSHFEHGMGIVEPPLQYQSGSALELQTRQ